MGSQGPLRVLLICPDPGQRMQLESTFASLEKDSAALYSLAKYPTGTELARNLRTFSPEAVFLSFEKLETAVAVVRYLEAEAEGLPVVAIHREYDPERMRESLHCGVREFLRPTFEPAQVKGVLEIVRKLLRRAPLSYSATDHIYSFLPAKPGVGTTTVALNVSAAFGRATKLKVLLTDLDLTCGMIRFLLKLPQDLSIADAVSRAEEMDTSLWPQLVSHRDGMDVLHSGTMNPQAYLQQSQVQSLIDFARCNYDALFFDMSGNLERHSLHVMQESKAVFLVCNPEASSLFLGREKLQFLRTLGLGDRVRAIVNRVDQPLAMPLDRVAEFLGIPVVAAIGDDSDQVNRATALACTLPFEPKAKKSNLSRQFTEFATALSQQDRHAPHPTGSPDLKDARVALA